MTFVRLTFSYGKKSHTVWAKPTPEYPPESKENRVIVGNVAHSSGGFSDVDSFLRVTEAGEEYRNRGRRREFVVVATGEYTAEPARLSSGVLEVGGSPDDPR